MTKANEWKAPTGRKIDPVLIAALLDAIGETFFHVHFYGKDGEIRAIPKARLNVTSRMVDSGNSGTNAASDKQRQTLAAHALIPVVDLFVEKGESRDKGWRSFKAERVAFIKGSGETFCADGYDPAIAIEAYREKRAEKRAEKIASQLAI